MTTRRTLLAAGGAALATAGCLGPPARHWSTPTGTPGGRFDDVACPSFADTDVTVCAHTAPLDADIVLEPSKRVFRPGGQSETIPTVTFTLHNRSDRPFTLNPHAWEIKRLEDGNWSHVAPDAHVEPLVEVAAGGTFEWILSCQPHPTPGGERTLYPTVDLVDGRYAYTVDGWLGSVDADERTTVETIALFDVRVVQPGTQPG